MLVMKLLCAKSAKQLSIHQLPPVLILHIKRFELGGYSVTKDQWSVSFPEVLDMAPYCTIDSDDTEVRLSFLNCIHDYWLSENYFKFLCVCVPKYIRLSALELNPMKWHWNTAWLILHTQQCKAIWFTTRPCKIGTIQYASDAPMPLFTSQSNTDIIYCGTGRFRYFALEAYNLFSLLFIIGHHTESVSCIKGFLPIHLYK